MMYRLIRLGAPCVLLSAFISLTACGTGRSHVGAGEVPQSSSAATVRTYVYECPDSDQFTVRTEGGTAWLFLASGTVRLSGVVSASGAKFSDGTRSYWSKGDEAVFVLDGRTYHGCRNDRKKAIWEDAKFRGVEFRAMGNEPGWLVEIHGAKRLVFSHNYGQKRYEFSNLRPLTDRASRTTRYELHSDAHRLSIALEGEPCTDSMSGEAYPTRVQLMFDGRPFSGCGKALY